MKRFIYTYVLLTLAAHTILNDTLYGQSYDADSLKIAVDELVTKKMNQYDIPGISIGIVSYDTIVYATAYGVNDIKTKKAVTENSIFHTASISKLFTAQAIMSLIEKGDLHLDDRITTIAPELRSTNQQLNGITIRQLLNHTSGLADVWNYNWGNDNKSDSALKNYLIQLDLDRYMKESNTYSYSNLGYDVLGYIIEKVAGTTFEDHVQDSILHATGMSNSDFRYYNIPAESRTSPHSKTIFNNTYIRRTYPYNREHGPSSTLNASSRDLSLWMISFLAILNNPEKTTYHQMIKSSFDANPSIGLGFQLFDIDSQKAIGHYGGDKGFRSFLTLIPQQNVGIVLLANCDYNEDFRQEIVYEIASLIMN